VLGLTSIKSFNMRRDKANGIIETGLIAGFVAVLVFATSVGINKNYQRWAGKSVVTIANSANGSTGVNGLKKSSTGSTLGSASVSSTGSNAAGVETAGAIGGVGTAGAMFTTQNGGATAEEGLDTSNGATEEGINLWDIIVNAAKDAVSAIEDAISGPETTTIASSSTVPTPSIPEIQSAGGGEADNGDGSLWEEMVEAAKDAVAYVEDAFNGPEPTTVASSSTVQTPSGSEIQSAGAGEADNGDQTFWEVIVEAANDAVAYVEDVFNGPEPITVESSSTVPTPSIPEVQAAGEGENSGEETLLSVLVEAANNAVSAIIEGFTGPDTTSDTTKEGPNLWTDVVAAGKNFLKKNN
jgi:hypothetical protein